MEVENMMYNTQNIQFIILRVLFYYYIITFHSTGTLLNYYRLSIWYQLCDCILGYLGPT